ncbi:hypothetical protein F2Q68_00026617 [Brassica cretica]|nr:hypothetical protein F2Q68_00026617 [Brassica cretica]
MHHFVVFSRCIDFVIVESNRRNKPSPMDLNVPSSSLRCGGVVLWDGRLLRELNGPKDLLDGLWWCDVSVRGWWRGPLEL